MQQKPAPVEGNPRTTREQVVTKAVLKTSEHLGINAATLGKILGVSPATVSRMANRSYLLKTNRKEFELGLTFLRLFRGLDAINGGDDRTNKSWIRAKNSVLGGVPLELIATIAGLVNTVAYVDTFRAKI
ncbi:MAG: DUF2384 domain-containing protein [Kordiimonadaceae bacterium]|nr:DUF2384 domain-containing protein [Kordiimonadaceae bacterium]